MSTDRSENSNSRASINTWTPFRCENLAVQDDYGKAFYDRNIELSTTPRRSSRFRQAVEYPRETNVGRRKRRSGKFRKVDSVKEVATEIEWNAPSRTGITTQNTDKLFSNFDCGNKWLPKIQVEKCSPDSTLGKNVQETKGSLLSLCNENSNGSACKTISAAQRFKNKEPAAGEKHSGSILSVYAPYFSQNRRNTPSKPHKSPRSNGSIPSTTKAYMPRSELGERTRSSAKSTNKKNSEKLRSRKNENRIEIPSPLPTLNKTPQLQRRSIKNYILSNKGKVEKVESILKEVSQIPKAYNFETDYSSLYTDSNTQVSNVSSSQNVCSRLLSNQKPSVRNRIEVSKIPVFQKNANDNPKKSKVIGFQEVSQDCITRINKVAERHEKNKTMYKSGFQKAGKKEIIKGVRSNRRFELQMCYRNTLY